MISRKVCAISIPHKQAFAILPEKILCRIELEKGLKVPSLYFCFASSRLNFNRRHEIDPYLLVATYLHMIIN
jgi:hypothetical protein